MNADMVSCEAVRPAWLHGLLLGDGGLRDGGRLLRQGGDDPLGHLVML